MITSYINGQYFDEALISPLDLGFLRGHGVIENFRTHQRQPCFLKKRLERLKKSANAVGIPLPQSFEEIEEIVLSLIENNGFVESIVRIILTKGLTEDGITPLRDSSLMILTTPFVPASPEYYQKGIHAVTVNETRKMPHVKTLNYLHALMLLEEARSEGAQEVLYCSNNEILEGTTCNFFAIKGSTLITAPQNILPGITREIILQEAKESFTIELRPLHLDEIDAIDEAFSSSSIKEMVPIVAINGQKIGSGTPGPKTDELKKLFFRALFEFAHD
ncbi:MAG: D-alanine aminotransferase [Chlamydiae bacterium]|nr:D-alanine aminotransferase [Chlamydiota bacterium]